MTLYFQLTALINILAQTLLTNTIILAQFFLSQALLHLPVSHLVNNPSHQNRVFEFQNLEKDTLNANRIYLQDTEAKAGLQESSPKDTPLAVQLPEIIGLFAVNREKGNFLSITANGQVSLWSLKDNSEVVIFPSGQPVTTCDYLNQGNLLAISQDTQVIIYSISEKRQLAISPRLGTKTSSLAFAPDGKSIVIGGEDGKVYRWVFDFVEQAEDSKIRLERYIGHSAALTALIFHPYNRFFFSADSFGNTSAWQTYDKDLFAGRYDEQKITTNFYAEESTRVLATAADNSTVLDMRISGDGQNLFSSLQDGRVEWRLVRGLKLIVSGKLNSGALYDIQVSPSGKQFASVARDGKLRIWKVNSIPAKTAVEIKDSDILKYNDLKADSLGYFELVKELELPEVRKIVFINESSLVVGEKSGRLLEVKL